MAETLLAVVSTTAAPAVVAALTGVFMKVSTMEPVSSMASATLSVASVAATPALPRMPDQTSLKKMSLTSL